jgi:UDP-N-acetylmuramate dehydrogenase
MPRFAVSTDDGAATGRSARVKLSAGWLIERCGWKGFRDGDAGVHERHALVLVNHGNATGAQMLALAQRIAASVRDRFGIELVPEPTIV